MKLTTLILWAISVGMTMCHVMDQQPDDLDAEWSNFKLTFNKQYPTPEEEMIRKEIFAKNLLTIRQHNEEKFQTGESKFSMGVNHFADMTPDEIKQRFTSNLDVNQVSESYEMMKQSNGIFVADPNVQVQVNLDWRNEDNIVSPVKDQGTECGACWAFAATSSMEGIMSLRTGKLVQFSEQELIDCARPYGANGCDGGYMYQAFEYITANKGIDTEKSYPYKNYYNKDVLKCNNQNGTKVDIPLNGYQYVHTGDEVALKQAVARFGPISAAIGVTNDFLFYRGGLYFNASCPKDVKSLRHGVTIVGYGTEFGKDYWIVKNSWGTDWGLKGYIYMLRNENNLCGIATQAVLPLFTN